MSVEWCCRFCLGRIGVLGIFFGGWGAWWNRILFTLVSGERTAAWSDDGLPASLLASGLGVRVGLGGGWYASFVYWSCIHPLCPENRVPFSGEACGQGDLSGWRLTGPELWFILTTYEGTLTLALCCICEWLGGVLAAGRLGASSKTKHWPSGRTHQSAQAIFAGLRFTTGHLYHPEFHPLTSSSRWQS